MVKMWYFFYILGVLDHAKGMVEMSTMFEMG